MKMYALILITALATTPCFATEKSRNIKTLKATIEESVFGENSENAGVEVAGGYLKITKREISVTLIQKFECKTKKADCMATQPSDIVYTAQYKSKKESACGTEYSAVTDETDRDGLKVEITVYDRSKSTCRMKFRYPTEATVQISGYSFRQPFVESNYFGAGKLAVVH